MKLFGKILARQGNEHYNTGIAFFNNGQYADAVAEFEKAIESISSKKDPYYNLGLFYAADLPREASVLLVSILILAAFFLLEFIRPRLWCRSLCPVGRMYGLFNRLSLLHLEFNPRECNSCRSCEEACYMGVRILSSAVREKVRDSSCILCGRCVEACPTQKGTLALRFGK